MAWESVLNDASERCISSNHRRMAQSSSTSWAIATSNGLSSEDVMRESPRRDSTTAVSRPVAGTWAESACARRTAMIWSTSSRGRPMAGATRSPPRTISRQKSARKSRSVCGRDFSEDHGISIALSRTKGLRRMSRNAGLLRGMASAGLRDLRLCEFGVLERRHGDNRVFDAMRLQKVSCVPVRPSSRGT